MSAFQSSDRGHKVAGFAIPATIFVMVVVSILALSGLYVAQNNLTANSGVRRGWKALYSADAGAAYALATWDGTAITALAPGDSLDNGWRSLPDSSVHRTVILRVDDGTPGTPQFYRLRTVGKPGRNTTAQRVLVTMVRGLRVDDLCCGSSILIQGRLGVRGTGARVPRIDGRDTPPGTWAGQCPPPQPDLPGVSIKDLGDLGISGNPVIEGSPPVEEDPAIDNDDFSIFGDLEYADLAAMAEKKFVGDQTLAAIAPSTSGGNCLTSDPSNWGDPLIPGSPCWNYLPIIHVEGSLQLGGDGYGQGIILVDGNFGMRGDFEFYGVVVVLGEATVDGAAKITGGLLVRNTADGTGFTEVRGTSVLQYSSCSVLRAEAAAASAQPLAGRHWFEVLE